ncbi:MAG: PIN domain-containing protein [Dehalococcoidia bacterium]
MSLLLDTDTLVEALRGHPRVTRKLGEPSTGEVPATAAVTLAELYYGAARSARPLEGAQGILVLLHGLRMIPVEERVGARFGILKAELRARGQLIPDFDLLIAATALVHDRTLVTHNTRHFSRIPGLSLLDWLAP